MDLVSIAAFALSLLNALYAWLSRRAKLRVDNCIIVDLENGLFLIDCCVSNLSSATISILQASLPWAPQALEAKNMLKNLTVDKKRIISDFPISLLPGDAKRISLLFHRPVEDQAPFPLRSVDSPNPGESPLSIDLSLHTPRKVLDLRMVARPVECREWIRQFG